MSTTTAKRGATVKPLALLASLTMIVTGLVGVAAAAPASAGSFTNGDDVYLNQGDVSANPDGTEDCVVNRDGWLFIVTADDWGDSTITFTNGGTVEVGEPVQKSKGAWHILVTTAPGATLNGATTYITDVQNANGNPQFTLSHSCAGTSATTSLTVVKEWVGTGSDKASEFALTLDETNAGRLTVKLGDAAPVAQGWGVPVTGLAVDLAIEVLEDTVPTLPTSPEGFTCSLVSVGYPTYLPSKTTTLAATANTVTVTNAVACLAITTPVVPVITPEQTVTPPVVVTAPVVEAAAAEAPAPIVAPAPLPATVAAPVKKPVVVSAPKPAAVAGGVVSTATIPQTATIPAAVPAGDGSQAPGLPMWALALVVIGALGAVVAGKQLLEARN